MNRFNRYSLFILVLVCGLPVIARAHVDAAQEKLIRETYKKLEVYNAAAQVFQVEQAGRRDLRKRAGLTFEVGEFSSGNVQEIANKRYAELVALPAGDVISLTHGSHRLDQEAEEATFAAGWERGQYASVFDPQWTINDVLNFEPGRY